MHERKPSWPSCRTLFIALPGGMGTFEVVRSPHRAQLGIHAKPVGILNACGYYDSLIQLFDRPVRAILAAEHRRLFHRSQPAELLRLLASQRPSTGPALDAT
jgi:predicted Rossmann-fold nucleotide-binding protein